MAAKPAEYPVVRIESRRGWLALDLGELWAYRDLVYFFVWRDIKVRYKQTVIGAAWAVLQPVLTMLVFSLFFGKLAKIPSGACRIRFFTTARSCPGCILPRPCRARRISLWKIRGSSRKFIFRAWYCPLLRCMSGLLDFAISFGVFLMHDGLLPDRANRCGRSGCPLFLLLAVLTALGVGLWLSALNALYRDVRYVVPFLVQFWMFASPVAYPSSLVPESGDGFTD